ncbi:MAG: DUF1343 domain-containing protein [Chlamydiae bacterium]|nr:DUF1343 domain-containing protein [Chlamydiota bacterium]
MRRVIFFILCLISLRVDVFPSVYLGVDRFFQEGTFSELKGKRIGLITNVSGVNRNLVSTIELFSQHKDTLHLVALFSPEHGLFGEAKAGKKVQNTNLKGIPVYSLHGDTRRPTEHMLQEIDVLIYDIQDVGNRPYTYATTLYYAMEEAAQRGIEVIVLDRPNPLGGDLVDGPMLEEGTRSFIGYIDVPYCHGMTIGELALFFNEEYHVGCSLRVVSMKGWKRSMLFSSTGLQWVPTSPYVPEASTPLFCATTGLIGELGIVNIGIGYTLPFKVIGAPWICGNTLAKALEEQNLPGVRFFSMRFTPQYGLYKEELCEGVLVVIVEPESYLPMRTQFYILGMLKSLYPKIMEKKLHSLSAEKKDLFCKASGGKGLFSLLMKERYPAWHMNAHQAEKRKLFLEKRKKYLLYN